ncbi:hypothetical protein [Kordiimonas aestuarii]|uniref:hypothetical protein n=1 Tax=Kordiimonas aestuarii TaxID=1005925 RepID=UPI0021CEBF69|nr:hypothetical protein [Kordiimonas aestuarii]
MMAEDKKVTSEINPSENQGFDESGNMQQLGEELSTVADQHRGLKTIVLVLGLVLVALFAFVVYAIANRAAESLMELEKPAGDTPIAAMEAVPDMAAGALAAGDYHVMRPEGSELMSVTGNARELIFHFRDGAGGDLVILLDRSSGRQTQVKVP